MSIPVPDKLKPDYPDPRNINRTGKLFDIEDADGFPAAVRQVVENLGLSVGVAPLLVADTVRVPVDTVTEIPFTGAPASLRNVTISIVCSDDAGNVASEFTFAGYLYDAKPARTAPPSGLGDDADWYDTLEARRRDIVGLFGTAFWRGESGLWVFTPSQPYAQPMDVSVWVATPTIMYPPPTTKETEHRGS